MNTNTFSLCLLTLLASCSSNTNQANDEDAIQYRENLLQSVGAEDMIASINVESRLVESADSVRNSLNQLAQVEIAAQPKSKFELSNKNQYQITADKKASVDWTGPAEPILRKIAASANYKLRVIGKKPPIPVLVTIKAKNTYISDIIRDISYQADNKAKIAVYNKNHTIELRYRAI
jgi:defect in organelle trafficking protein DotD